MHLSRFLPAIALAAGLALTPAFAPVHASGSVNPNPPRVCFENGTSDRLYFRAVYANGATGGSSLGAGGKFCSANPTPNAVRISRERDSSTLCTRRTQAGQSYRLTLLTNEGNCRWSAEAH